MKNQVIDADYTPSRESKRRKWERKARERQLTAWVQRFFVGAVALLIVVMAVALAVK